MSTPMERAKSMPLPDHLPPHPPAQKVGGRRLSMTSRSRPHAAHSEQKPAADTAENDTGPTDYPRPAPPGDQPPHEHHPQEEEQPKREKHHGLSEHERRLMEAQYKKGAPRRMSTGGKTGHIRIAQPASKAFGV